MIKVLGCYEINLNKKINEGSQAQIFECLNTDTNQVCCARVIDKKQLNNTYYLKQFEEEIKVIEQLKWQRHENLLTIYDYKEEEDSIYQFAEKCDETLLDFMKQGKTMLTIDFLQFIKQISSGYLQLMKINVIHRDLKPENILIKYFQNKSTFKISDFGISKILDQQTDRINTYGIGTQNYSSPEMLSQTGNYNYESDIFSFGIILYESTSERSLFKNLRQQKEFFESLKKQSFKKYLQENNLNINIQDRILDLLDQLIVHDPKQRISWENLNKLAINQTNEFFSYNLPISQTKEQRGESMHQSTFDSSLTENFNHLNLQFSQSQVREYNAVNNLAQVQNSFGLKKQDFMKQKLDQNQLQFQRVLPTPMNNRQNLCHTISYNQLPQTNLQQQNQIPQTPCIQQQFSNNQQQKNLLPQPLFLQQQYHQGPQAQQQQYQQQLQQQQYQQQQQKNQQVSRVQYQNQS
ncbi:unnamed protein product [Paramecium sonneborni]|uniref:Protein kinase domain-containing protein n=1 Tax=Paramecium sonneborni TaxID=65129 RepID=A0A8S1LWJ0_9CILI|nr:unnamed protein product [Paramecium sonneborni]